MTLIVSTCGLIIADSARSIDGEMKHVSTGKIKTFGRPIVLQGKRSKIKDTFYGFAGSGEESIIKAAGITTIGISLDSWLDSFKYVDSLRFITDDTNFLIMFFGYKGTLMASIASGYISMQYRPYSQQWMSATGSGAESYRRIVQEYKSIICPVRAAYAAFTMEPTCGGALEVWKLPTLVKGKMIKIGERPPSTLATCYKEMATPTRCHYPEEMQEWLQIHTPTPVLPQPSRKSSPVKNPPMLPPLVGFQGLDWTKHWPGPIYPRSKKSTPSPSTST